MSDDILIGAYASWVVANVRAADIREKAYFLSIGYSDDSEPVQTTIGIGLDRERQTGDDEAKREWAVGCDWYNPANFENCDTVALCTIKPPTLDTSTVANNGWRDFYVALAQALADRDWSGELAVTDDFVVFATDYHLEHLAANFHLCVPVALRERLLADGWISEQMAREQESQ